MNVCTKWAFHLELLTKNDWTKRSKLCDQMGLDKITSKWILNLCLCRWNISIKTNQIIGPTYWSNYWKFIWPRLLFDLHYPGNSRHSLISLYQFTARPSATTMPTKVKKSVSHIVNGITISNVWFLADVSTYLNTGKGNICGCWLGEMQWCQGICCRNCG